LAGETASPILPTTPDGSPRAVPVSFVQVAPPSVDLWIPECTPPLDIDHGVRYACHMAAYSTSGFDGSITRSIAPVESLTNRILRKLFPPSVLL
jgi:hypothetical protein